ncbi:hypothetical protein F2Q69_00023331 [Brassica cretica]|uniref:Uncharacterized protein n=1 Tax=Brassica cretica TaxID=69181 RepID=A0A8S9Q9Q3_BRACR|nr:hypothetical protein F2Q69_00023331 [Brassica cretica]
MEDMNFGRKSIDAQTTTSSDTKFDRHSGTNIDRRHPAGSSQTFLREGDEEEHVDLIDETDFRKQRLADQQQNMSFTRTCKAEQTHKSKLESKSLLQEKPPEAKKATINLDEEEEESEEDVKIDRKEGNNVDRPTTVNIDRQNENNVDRRSTPAKPAVERVYWTFPPFPSNKTQTKKELDKAICKKAFDKITLKMPLSDAIKVSPSIKKYVKDMVSNSFPAAEHSVMMVSEEVSAIIQATSSPLNYERLPEPVGWRQGWFATQRHKITLYCLRWDSQESLPLIRIMTHEEFEEKHPHPPSPFYVKIDRPHEPAVDRQRETDIDRPPSPPNDRRAPLTYRVRLPSIDNDRINALRPPPKPLANPPEPTTNPSDTTPEPMQVDEATERRRLRKRKEKIPKNLKREANEKEMDGFTKRVLRIPVEKPFDKVYFTHRLWMFFRETKETEEDIRRMFHHVRERMKLRITLKKKSDPGKFVIPCVVKESIDTHTASSIDSTESSIDSTESPTADEHYPMSLDGKYPVDHFTLPDQWYPNFAFQQPNKRGRDDYSIGSWADSGFHESFAVETVIPSSNEDPTEEYDEDYWKKRAIEIAMQDDRYSSHSFNNTSPPSIGRIYSASVDTHPHPAKRSYASIDTTPGTSIDIKAAALKKKKGNIPIPSRFTNTYIRSFAPQITYHDTEAEKMNALTNQSKGTLRKSIRSKNPNSADKRLPSIDTPGPRWPCKSMDGRILQVSREDIADILQVANGPDNLFMQQCSIPDNIPVVQDEYPRADTTEIGSHQSCRPVGQASIDKVAPTSFDRVTPMSLGKAPSPSIDRRYEFGHRAYDIYGARKFRWEQKEEYGVYRDESGYANSRAGEMIPVTKDNIRKFLERASLFEESHLCLPEHAASFTPTKLAPEIYTKDEINEMVTGICGAQEKLGDELKTLVDDTYQPLDRGYNEFFRSMAEMRTKIESMQHNLKKEATTSPSIDANKATSIDVKP